MENGLKLPGGGSEGQGEDGEHISPPGYVIKFDTSKGFATQLPLITPTNEIREIIDNQAIDGKHIWLVGINPTTNVIDMILCDFTSKAGVTVYFTMGSHKWGSNTEATIMDFYVLGDKTTDGYITVVMEDYEKKQ